MSDRSYLVQPVWVNDEKGLRKELITFNFKSMIRANELSRCTIRITDLKNPTDHSTNILTPSNLTDDCSIDMGRATTAIDYYLEQLIEEMFIGEKSKCWIETGGGTVEFILQIISIEFRGYLHQLELREIYEIAGRYKTQGTEMYPKYRKFAQEYYCRAVKLLASFQPFETLELDADYAVTISDIRCLYEMLCTNIAACLLAEQRYEDVKSILMFTDDRTVGSEKAIYRRARAHYHLKEFEVAKELLERLNLDGNSDVQKLYADVVAGWKRENLEYTNIVKRMFPS